MGILEGPKENLRNGMLQNHTSTNAARKVVKAAFDYLQKVLTASLQVKQLRQTGETIVFKNHCKSRKPLQGFNSMLLLPCTTIYKQASNCGKSHTANSIMLSSLSAQ